MNQKINCKFLESKFLDFDSPKDCFGHHEIIARSGSGNLSRLSNNIFSFVEYNFLPGEDGILDGHYRFFVNKETFEILFCKDSDYGGLTYTKAVEFNGFIPLDSLCKRERRKVESIVAYKLYGAYFYDSDHVNQQGKNLIKGCDSKRSLITDDRGYMWSEMKPEEYSPVELLALNKMIGFSLPEKKEVVIVDKKITKYETSYGKGSLTEIKLSYDDKEYVLVHKRDKICKGMSVLLFGKKEISNYFLNHKLESFVEQIPVILSNYAE